MVTRGVHAAGRVAQSNITHERKCCLAYIPKTPEHFDVVKSVVDDHSSASPGCVIHLTLTLKPATQPTVDLS